LIAYAFAQARQPARFTRRYGLGRVESLLFTVLLSFLRLALEIVKLIRHLPGLLHAECDARGLSRTVPIIDKTPDRVK